MLPAFFGARVGSAEGNQHNLRLRRVARALIACLPHYTAPNGLRANVDTRLLLFAFLVSMATGFLAGSAPALQAGRESLVSSLRERAGTGFGGLRLRRVIVTAQI